MGWERWPKIVGEALSRLQNNGHGWTILGA